MRSPLLFIAVGALGALGACSGVIGEDPTAGEQTEAQRTFSSTVSPLLRGQCAACHEGATSGPPFIGQAGGDDDYSALRSNGRIVAGFDDSAPLLTKGPHSGAQWWTASQAATITSWFALERDNTLPGDQVGDVMAVWAGCMTLDNWNDSMMGMWAAKQTDQGATCGGCHGEGEHGFHANPTSDIMFAQQRTQIGIDSFFQVSAAGAEPSVVPAFDKLRNKCGGGNLHPRCGVDDQYVAYLERFYELTLAVQHAGLCGEPGYKTLVDPL